MTAAIRQRVPLLSDDTSKQEDNSNYGNRLSNRQKKYLVNTTPIWNILPDTAPKIHHHAIRLNERDQTQALCYLLDQN